MAQMLKRLPTTRETWVQSLGREDLLEKEMATHFSILAWEIHGQRSLVAHTHTHFENVTSLGKCPSRFGQHPPYTLSHKHNLV